MLNVSAHGLGCERRASLTGPKALCQHMHFCLNWVITPSSAHLSLPRHSVTNTCSPGPVYNTSEASRSPSMFLRGPLVGSSFSSERAAAADASCTYALPVGRPTTHVTRSRVPACTQQHHIKNVRAGTCSSGMQETCEAHTSRFGSLSCGGNSGQTCGVVGFLVSTM